MSLLARRVRRAGEVLVALCVGFLIFVLVSWALGFVHITGIHHTTIHPRVHPSLEA